MTILAIGAHPDDIEIGCGGALARHVAEGHTVHMLVMTYGDPKTDKEKTRYQEAQDAAKILGAASCRLLPYQDTRVPQDVEAIMQIEKIVKEVKPDRVYMPYEREIHQDHRNTSFNALAACRNVSQVLMYEGPSTMNDFRVSFWVNIEGYTEVKAAAIRAHASEGAKEILKVYAVLGLNGGRGYQARSTFAEGFSVFRYLE